MTEVQNKFFEYIVRDGNAHEIRVLFNNNGPRSFFSSDVSRLIEYANEMESEHGEDLKGVYFTINPLASDIKDILKSEKAIAVAAGKKAPSSASDHHVTRRQILYIDIDPIKYPEPPLEGNKVSSTPDELAKTLAVTDAMIAWIAENGITQEPVKCLSGNGYSLYYAIDMDNDDVSHNLIADFLQTLSNKFTCDVADIDVKVKNAARITKVIGTWARKGENEVEPGRSHRQSTVVQFPSVSAEEWQTNHVTADQLEVIAMMSRVEKKEKVRKQTADRVAKARGGRVSEYKPREAKEKKQMTTYINRNDFIINNAQLWIEAAYDKVTSPADRNQWLGMLTSIKTILGEAGWNRFDNWCSTSTGYDAAGNRQAWDAPARAEDYATEANKLAWSFMKLGVSIDEIAEDNGYELSKESIMSIDEIKAAIAADNSLTVRWAYSARQGTFYPAGVWTKDVYKRRLETMNDAVRAQAMMSLFISTENDNGFLKPIEPFVMGGTTDLYVYNEDFGIWNKLEDSKMVKMIQSLNGFTIVGKKDGQVKTLSSKDVKHDVRQIVAAIDQTIPNCSKKLAFNNTALVFDGANVIERKAKVDDMFTHKMDMVYGGAQATPQFDAILDRLFESDAERIECYLQWAGAAIMGATTSLQIPMMLLVSEVGGTGKSMLLKLLELIIGTEKTKPVLLKDLSDRGHLITIASKSLVIDYDINLDNILDNIDILKNLITGEGMSQRELGNGKTHDVRYRGAICGAANGMPHFKRYDSGLDRRILIMPTTNIAISKKEVVREYETKLFTSEGAGIVHKMIEAFKRMLAVGELSIPTVCQEAKEVFRSEVDVVSTWFSHGYEFDANEKALPARDLYNDYRGWCQLNGHNAMSSTKFVTELKSKAVIAGCAAHPKNVVCLRYRVKRAIGFSVAD